MNLHAVKKAIEKAEEKAKDLGTAVSVAVVDEYGVLVAFSRMDEAIKISPKFAYAKAYTAASLGMPTDSMAPFSQEGKPYHDLNSLFGGSMTTIAGGVPILKDGKIIGGVGVGGSQDVSQDLLCAQEAVKELS